MEQRLSVVTLGVADLDRAAAFYERGLGWTPIGDDPGIVFYQLPGMILGLWSRQKLADEAGLTDTGSSFGGISLAYNARSRNEVDAVLGEARVAGGTITAPANETFWGGYSGYFTDPDGHAWEVAHNPFWVIGDDGRVTIPTKA
ncbi:MAG: VOC family protein [Pseudomonadota bacterium]